LVTGEPETPNAEGILSPTLVTVPVFAADIVPSGATLIPEPILLLQELWNLQQVKSMLKEANVSVRLHQYKYLQFPFLLKLPELLRKVTDTSH
jgi:hypothetical protein